jgi:DUF1680 family protein
MTQSRRSFLKSSAAAAAATLAAPRSTFAALATDNVANGPLSEFGYAEIELLDGPLLEQFKTNHIFYLSLDEDMLLKPYRQRAGLPAPGDDMGGWYDWVDTKHLKNNHGFCPGGTFGQYLSGLSRDFAATGNKQTQEKVHRLVKGYAAAISPKYYQGNRFPAYVYDKGSIGLLDAHRYGMEYTALRTLNATIDAALPYLPPRGISRDEQYARPHTDPSWCWDEPYTLPENLFIAYKCGAGDRFLDLAKRFLADDWYFGPLAAGQNVLPGKHAYSHVNALSSAMQAYLVMGSEKHLQAAKNGFDFLRTTQSFATGGWGPDEEFCEPGSGVMGESLTKTHSSFETCCGTYAQFKITRYLLRVTKDSRYGDSMERILFNTIMGAKPMQKDGHGFYYSDYNNDGFKIYHPEQWTCCTGTFAQVTADYGISSYFGDSRGIYVNLYIPSRLTWSRGREVIAFTQETNYPHHPSTRISIDAAIPSKFPIYLRIPAWAGPKTTVAVNEKHVLASPAPGQFARLEGVWKTGDRIEIEFDMPTVLEAVDPQHPDLVALVHGPLALFGVGAIPDKISRQQLLSASQTANGSTDWQANTAAGNLNLRPFASIKDEHYRLYLNVKG